MSNILEEIERFEAELKARKVALTEKCFPELVRYHAEHEDVPIRVIGTEFVGGNGEVYTILPTAYSLDNVVLVICSNANVDSVLWILPFSRRFDQMEKFDINPLYDRSWKGLDTHVG